MDYLNNPRMRISLLSLSLIVNLSVIKLECASESDSKSNELKMSIRALLLCCVINSLVWFSSN